MERLKHSNRIVRLANDIIRPSPFTISRKKDLYNGELQVYQYGNCKVMVTGRLYEEDRGTLICLLEMSKNHDNKPFDYVLSDIAKEKGIKNIHDQDSLYPIRESIDRLLDAQIRLKPSNGRGLTAKFSFIEGWLDSDDTGNLNVSPYLNIVRDLTLGTTRISLPIYFHIKSQIGRSLYAFLESQQNFYSGKGYSIRLSLLLKHLNYDTLNRPWWQIYPNVKNAIEELISTGLIQRFTYEKDQYKADGGKLSFYPVKRTPKKISQGKENGEFIDLIKETFGDKVQLDDNSGNKFRSALNKAIEFIKTYDTSFKYFLKDYCDWLDYRNLKYISPALFNPENEFFQEYIKNQTEDGNLSKIKAKSKSIPIDKGDQKELIKQRAEYKLQRMERIKHLMCPFGHVFGKDYEEYDDCLSCQIDKDCKIGST